MMKLILCLFGVCLTTTLSAQLSVANTSMDVLPISTPMPLDLTSTTPPDLKEALLGISPTLTAPANSLTMRYQHHLAFFCRVEVKIDKAVKMPVRFRLGSVDYVDYLEGKRDYAPRQ